MDEFLFLDVSALVLVGVSASGLLSPCVPFSCSFFGFLCGPRVCFPLFVSQHGCVVFGFVFVSVLLPPFVSQTWSLLSLLSAFVFLLSRLVYRLLLIFV